MKGTEIDMSRAPSLRLPSTVTLPPKRGLVLMESPTADHHGGPTRGGGRSSGTVDVRTVNVGDDLVGITETGTAFDEAFSIGMYASPPKDGIATTLSDDGGRSGYVDTSPVVANVRGLGCGGFA